MSILDDPGWFLDFHTEVQWTSALDPPNEQGNPENSNGSMWKGI